MKKAFSLMLALILALSMLGFPAFADDTAPFEAASAADLQVASDAEPSAAPKDDAKKLVLDKDSVSIKQKDGSKVPESGFPLTKKNKLVVRVNITGGGEKTTAKGRMSIGTDVKKPKKDLVKSANNKTKLSGASEFTFTTTALKALKTNKEYKLFFQSSKTKNYPAIPRMEIGTIKVISAKDAEKLKPTEQPQQTVAPDQTEDAGDEDEDTDIVDDEDDDDDNIMEATDVESAANQVEGVIAKDLRKALTVSSMTLTPADGVITNLNSGMTVTVKLSGGTSKENVQGNILLLDASDKVALGADKAYIATKTDGSTTFTFTGSDLVKLASGTYKVAIDTQGTPAYAPLEMLPTAKTVTINQERKDVPTLASMALSQPSWDLVDNKTTDVVLTAQPTPELLGDVKATFSIMSNDTTPVALITAEGTLSKTAETKVTFPASKLLTLPAAANGTTYKVYLQTAQSLEHKEKANAATAMTLTVTGTTRTAYAITGGSIDDSNFTENTVGTTTTKQYVLYSGKSITLKEVTSDAPADVTLPVRVTIGSDGFYYDTNLTGKTGSIVIPSSALVAAAAAGTLKTTVSGGTTPAGTDAAPNPTATPIVDNKLAVTVQILPTATLKESDKKNVGSLSIAKNPDTTTSAAVKFTTATITNGDYMNGSSKITNAFARARGVTSGLKVTVKLTANHATTTTGKIDIKGNLTISTGTAGGTTGYTVDKPYLAEIPFSFTQDVGSTTGGGSTELTVPVPANVLNALPEYTSAKPVNLYFGINIAGNDLVEAFTYNNSAIGWLQQYDGFLPTPVFDGTVNEKWTWTKGGAKKTIGNISFTDGVVDRTTNGKVYALKSKLTTTPSATVPTGAVELGSGKVSIQGKTATFTLTQKKLNSLAAGVYYLYVQAEKTDKQNNASQMGSGDRGYIGKLTVKAAATGGGSGGSSGGSTGGGTNDNTGGSTSTDGGTDTVAGATDKAADTTSASQIAFGTYQTFDSETLAWMLARQPLMGREFLKYLLNQKGSQKVAIPLAYVADMENAIKVPIVGGGQYDLGLAVFTPATEGETTGYTFTVEPKSYADTSGLKMHLGADFEDLARTLTDADYYKPGDFVPVSTLKLAQLDGEVKYETAQAEQVKIDSAVTNRITEWMAQG